MGSDETQAAVLRSSDCPGKLPGSGTAGTAKSHKEAGGVEGSRETMLRFLDRSLVRRLLCL